jgi:uncharacterized RDD family membrane protein YckC
MTAAPAAAGALPTPALARRLACFLYEGVLLFGVVMATGLVYGLLTQQRHALVGLHGLQAVLFVVLGLYFVSFWSRSGQTLAMQTWHIRLVTRDGGAVSRLRALARYLCAYLWFLPALVSVWASGLIHSAAAVGGAIVAGVLAYAGLTRLHPDRQYWHDAVCGTRLVDWRPQPKP